MVQLSCFVHKTGSCLYMHVEIVYTVHVACRLSLVQIDSNVCTLYAIMRWGRGTPSIKLKNHHQIDSNGITIICHSAHARIQRGEQGVS